MLSPAGLSMADYKVKTIQEWPEQRKVKDIQSFLGFANFYWRFIFNYSDITIPLTCLTRKGIVWNFTLQGRESFETLKKAFTSAPVLTHWVPNVEEFALGIDPKSLHAMVLMQTVYYAVIRHSGGFLKHVAISVTEKGRNNGGID